MVEQIGLTGPFVAHGAATLDQAGMLLRGAAERQLAAMVGRPLAQLMWAGEIAGGPAALYERLLGPSLAELEGDRSRRALPAIARALLDLHAAFGGHGDLKPGHVFVGHEDVAFIDPLGTDEWLGSRGYTLPLVRPMGGVDRRFRDIVALAAIAIELWSGSPPWAGRLLYLLLNRLNGRFGGGFSFADLRRLALEPADRLPEPHRRWVIGVVEEAFDGDRAFWDRLEVGGAITEQTVDASSHPDARWVRGMLERIADIR
jgi:hypothetical protein